MKRKPISEQLRDAIKASKDTRYQIARATKISDAVLSRFITENVNERRDIRMGTADRLAKHLKLTLVAFKGK